MSDLPRMDRRQAIKWMIAATAALSLPKAQNRSASRAVSGYGTDPNVMEVYKPGEFWPLTFTDEQRKTVAALCDVIIPADANSPSASKLSVHDFIDEWISAPYPRQQDERKIILEGLKWLDNESKKRFRKLFIDLTEEQKRQICDDICFVPKAAAVFKKPARFFGKFRDLTMAGFSHGSRGLERYPIPWQRGAHEIRWAAAGSFEVSEARLRRAHGPAGLCIAATVRLSLFGYAGCVWIDFTAISRMQKIGFPGFSAVMNSVAP